VLNLPVGQPEAPVEVVHVLVVEMLSATTVDVLGIQVVNAEVLLKVVVVVTEVHHHVEVEAEGHDRDREHLSAEEDDLHHEADLDLHATDVVSVLLRTIANALHRMIENTPLLMIENALLLMIENAPLLMIENVPLLMIENNQKKGDPSRKSEKSRLTNDHHHLIADLVNDPNLMTTMPRKRDLVPAQEAGLDHDLAMTTNKTTNERANNDNEWVN